MATRADEKRGNPPAAPGKVSFHVYIDGRVKAALRKMAKKEQRNINAQAERLLRAALEKEGFI